MSILEKKDFSHNTLDDSLNEKTYTPTTHFSNFPNQIDNLKTLKFNANSSAEINMNFEKYYNLMDEFLSNPQTFSKMEELKSVIAYIRDYVLSSEDYAILRDSLIEISNYLNQIINIDLYDSETGIYNKMETSFTNFTKELNGIIENINAAYNNFAGDSTGKVLPNGSINTNYLDPSLKEAFEYIGTSSGVYVDRTGGENIVVPGTGKPIVIKIYAS